MSSNDEDVDAIIVASLAEEKTVPSYYLTVVGKDGEKINSPKLKNLI
jgi:hypothetical protein